MVDILAFGAHPDDIDFACGAILAKMAAQKKSIVLVDLTLGDKGTHGVPEERRQESENAAAVIGAKRVFLDFKDCEVVDTYEGRLKLVKLIREHKPRLVIGPFWKGEQNHPDHLACGQMVRYACRYARFANILPEIPIHWIDGVLHYPPPTYEKIDFIVDVTDVVDVWKKMMRCHATQMQTFAYEDWCLKVAAKLGVLIGKPFAQGLVKGNPIIIDDIMSVAKGAREL